jgi:hypothetical protein
LLNVLLTADLAALYQVWGGARDLRGTPALLPMYGARPNARVRIEALVTSARATKQVRNSRA